jgi:hypothetical protein
VVLEIGIHLLSGETIHRVGECYRDLVCHPPVPCKRIPTSSRGGGAEEQPGGEGAEDWVEWRRSDDRLAMGLGRQPPPAGLLTRMSMPPAAPPETTTRLHHAAIATDPAGRHGAADSTKQRRWSPERPDPAKHAGRSPSAAHPLAVGRSPTRLRRVQF